MDEAATDVLSNLVFGYVLAQPLAGEGEGLIHDAAQLVGGATVVLELLRGPTVGGGLHQVRRRDYIDPQAPDQLDRAGVDPGYPRQFVTGRVLHGNLRYPGKEPSQGLHHAVAVPVNGEIHARGGEFAGVHMVNQEPGQAGGGQEKVTGPSDVSRGLYDLPEDGVGGPVVVDQPAGNFFGPEELLGGAVYFAEIGCLDAVIGGGHAVPSP